MKMEQTVTAPAAGMIDRVLCEVGDQVREGAELLAFEDPPSRTCIRHRIAVRRRLAGYPWGDEHRASCPAACSYRDRALAFARSPAS